MKYYVVEPCTTAGGIEIKLQDKRIDLKKAEKAFSRLGEVVGSSAVVLLVRLEGCSISVYGSGRMMVKGKISQKEGQKLADRLIEALEKAGAVS
ncbi:MAG: hypothetical protein AB1529_03930 [Candidatus Micrarchaeota archaeon]